MRLGLYDFYFFKKGEKNVCYDLNRIDKQDKTKQWIIVDVVYTGVLSILYIFHLCKATFSCYLVVTDPIWQSGLLIH